MWKLRRRSRHIAASQLAEMAYCEQKAVLRRRLGERETRLQRNARERGLNAHAAFHSEALRAYRPDGRARQAADRGCFIATAVYGATHPATEQLRRFRDERLRRSGAGRVLIAAYYAASPRIAAVLERTPPLRAVARRVLDGIRVALVWMRMMDRR